MDTNLQIEELQMLVHTMQAKIDELSKQVDDNKNYISGQSDFQVTRPLDNLTANVLDDKTKDIRNYKRVRSTTTVTTLTISAETDDAWLVTALASALTIAQPSGNPTNLQPLIIRIKDDGTARALTWNGVFRGTLPATTTISKTMYLGFFYNEEAASWDLVAFKDGL